jgi:hypothetical protein
MRKQHLEDLGVDASKVQKWSLVGMNSKISFGFRDTVILFRKLNKSLILSKDSLSWN